MQRIITASRSDTNGRSSLSITTTVPASSFYCLEPEEVTEVKEKNIIKDDNVAKKSRSATRTDYPTEGNFVVDRPDAGRASVADGPTLSPTGIPGCFANRVRARSKKRYVWRRVKQLIVRSMST